MKRFNLQIFSFQTPTALFSVFLLGLIVNLNSCGSSSSKSTAMDSPEATLNTLQSAIADRNLETYEKLWHPGRVEREGMLSQLKAKPKTWEELDGIFKGEISIVEKDNFERDGNKMCKLGIKSPDADQGGIGAMTMIKVDDNWLLWSW